MQAVYDNLWRGAAFNQNFFTEPNDNQGDDKEDYHNQGDFLT